MGQSVSAYTSYADYRPDVAVIAHSHHAPFPANITAGLAQDPPSVAALQELSGFMKLFFYVPLSSNVYIAFFTGLIYLGLLIIAAVAIGIYRWRRGQFWIIRLERRARGLYIVPNALNAFLLCELAFCFSWGVYGIAAFESYRVESWFFIRKMEAVSLHCWIPLYIGILSAAVGSFFSVPGALDPGSNAAHFHNIMRRPWVINTITVGLPLALLACITPLCVLGQLSRSRNIVHFHDFAGRIDGSIMTSNLSAVGLDSALVQSYLQEASDLWSESADNHWTRAAWSVWNAFYCFLFLFYSIAGGWMLLVVRRQVEASRAIVDKEEKFQRELVVAHSDAATALLFQPLLSPGASITPATECHVALNSGSKHSPSLTTTALSSPSTACSPLQSEKKFMQSDDVEAAAEAATEQSVLPHSQPRPAEPQHPAASAAKLRWMYLRRCLRSLVIMYAGIIAVLGASIGTGAFLTASTKREWLKGPEQSAYVFSVYVLVQTWCRVIFGTITLGAVVFRSFDHSAMSGASSDTPSDKKEAPVFARSRCPAASEANGEVGGGVGTISSTTSPTQVLQDQVGLDLASVPENATLGLPAARPSEEMKISDSCQTLLTEPRPQTAEASTPSVPDLKESHGSDTEANGLESTATPLSPSRRPVGNALASLASAPATRSPSVGNIDLLVRPASSHSLNLLALHSGANYDSRARRFSASAPPPSRPLPTPVPRPDKRPESASSVSSSATTRQRRASNSTSLAQRRASNSTSLAQRRASANTELAYAAKLLQLTTTTEIRRDSCLIEPEYTPADRTGWRTFVPEIREGNAASPFQAGWNGFAAGAAAFEEDGHPSSETVSALLQPVRMPNTADPAPAATGVSSDEVGHLPQVMPRSASTGSAVPPRHPTESSSSSPPAPDSPIDCEAYDFEQNTP